MAFAVHWEIKTWTPLSFSLFYFPLSHVVVCRKMRTFRKKCLQNCPIFRSTTLQTIYQHQLLVLPMSMFPAIVFQHYAWQIPTGLLVYPIHSAGIHHDKCSSLSKLLPTTPAGYTNVHVSSHRLPISVCSVVNGETLGPVGKRTTRFSYALRTWTSAWDNSPA